jgi:hypothetical protein
VLPGVTVEASSPVQRLRLIQLNDDELLMELIELD